MKNKLGLPTLHFQDGRTFEGKWVESSRQGIFEAVFRFPPDWTPGIITDVTFTVRMAIHTPTPVVMSADTVNVDVPMIFRP
jgi:hypothetical protein